MKISNHYKGFKQRQIRRFHVAYNYMGHDGRGGVAHIELSFTGKVKLDQLVGFIKNSNPYMESVIVLSWQEKMK